MSEFGCCGRSPAEGAYSEGFMNARLNQVDLTMHTCFMAESLLETELQLVASYSPAMQCIYFPPKLVLLCHKHKHLSSSSPLHGLGNVNWQRSKARLTAANCAGRLHCLPDHRHPVLTEDRRDHRLVSQPPARSTGITQFTRHAACQDIHLSDSVTAQACKDPST